MRYRGILTYLEGDDTSAKHDLEASLKITELNKHHPFRDGNISLTKANLCCVLARQGDMTRANKYFAQAKTYLIATEDSELMEECKKALGNCVEVKRI